VNPELPLSPTQRKTIYREAWRLWGRDRRNILLYLMLPALYLMVVFFAGDLGEQAATAIGLTGLTHKLVRAAGPVFLLVVCFAGGGAVLQRCRFGPCVFRATRNAGYDVCPTCGYWLRGLREEITSCPECGVRREPMPSDTE